MNAYSMSVSWFSYGVLLIAILVLIKRQDLISIKFLVFSIVVSVWGLLTSQYLTNKYSAIDSLSLARWAHLFSVFIPVTWVDFVLNLLNAKPQYKYFFKLNYTIAVFLAVLTQTDFFVARSHTIWIFEHFPKAGAAYSLFAAHFFFLVPFAFSRLWNEYRYTHGQRQNQLKYLIIGTLIGFAAGGLTFPAVYGINIPQYLLLAMPVYPIFTGLALIRYGLFDTQQIADAFQREKLAVLGTVAASMNHEIRNPMFIARGKMDTYFDAVERSLYPDTEKRLAACESTLQETRKQFLRAIETIQKFSDFARPFKKKEDNQKVVIRETLESVLQFVSNEFALHKIRLNQSGLDGVVISANRRQIEEILFNLILNACHAMGENGGALDIAARQAGKNITIEIKDTGPGMIEEQFGRIFEPFYTTKEDKGTGLGLYITKQLVERNGGKISVRSKPGEGTAFRLEFNKAL